MSVSAADVKTLREKTGAGMMDCKQALKETNGDIEAAIDFLRKKGMQKVEKKSGRATKQGIVYSYIHPGNRLGVLVEIACETDFVARTDDFVQFAKDVAMHIAASNPRSVSREEVTQDDIDREMDIYRAQAREQGKPENVIEKMITGKLNKYYEENCLLEQPFVKDTKKTVQEYLKETIAKLGENMMIRRFARFEVGEE